MFISVHTAKGLEFPVVLMADDFRCPYRWDKELRSWRLLELEGMALPYHREESNILYVALTRAQRVQPARPHAWNALKTRLLETIQNAAAAAAAAIIPWLYARQLINSPHLSCYRS